MKTLIQKFEDYLRGEMPLAEANQFLTSLNEEELKSFKEYEKIRRLMSEKQSKVPEELQDRLNQLGDKYFKEGSKSPIQNKKRNLWLIIFLCAFLFLGMLGYYFMSSPKMTKEEVIAEYFYSKKSDVVTRGETTELSHFEKGIIEYEAGNDLPAIGHWMKIKETDSIYMESAYYRANAYFRIGNPLLAVQMYRKFAGEGTTREDYADWNMIIAYYQLDDLENAHRVLDRIISQKDHLFYEKAKELKSKID